MSPPSIQLAPTNPSLLPSLQPNLLPVNIPWDGPAPVSQYFLVQPVIDPDEAARSLPTPVSENGDSNEEGNLEALLPKLSLKKRFIAAFRGRKMQGLEVNLPVGMTGLVLRPADPMTRERIERTIQRRRKEMIVDDDMGEEGNVDELSGSGEKRYLEPIAKFSSFIHWNPDVRVDETRDEYIQGLTQWRRICSKVTL